MNSISWIPVESMLPEDGSRVLVWTTNDKIMILNSIDTSWHIDKYNITFWMYPVSPYDLFELN